MRAQKNFIVYKNKDTDERAIRYEGKDEAYAVNELYMKLKEEIFNQKQNNSNRRVIYSNKKSKPNFVALVYLLILFVTSLGGYIYGKVNTL